MKFAVLQICTDFCVDSGVWKEEKFGTGTTSRQRA